MTGKDNDVVHGVIYEIAQSDKPSLDTAEGLGAGYDEKEVEVHTPDGIVRVHLYYATHIDPAMVPFDWYKAFVVAGARQHALPAGYIERLMAVRSIPDADPARTRMNQRLLDPAAS
jgi:hypothetical protein